jgi:polyisoprenoid-binding protein YceI
MDGDDTLRRMTSLRLGQASGLVLLGLLGVLYITPILIMVLGPDHEEEVGTKTHAIEKQQTQGSAGDTNWIVLPEASTVEFEALQYGQPFKGRFLQFDAAITFDPNNLAASTVLVTIPVSGISTGDSARDAQARDPQWFDAATYPQIVFFTQSISAGVGPGQYLAHGTLTMRGITKPIDLPFFLAIEEQNGTRTARMQADITVNRLDFGIGQGEWAKTDVIADAIRIAVRLQAVANPPAAGQ